MNKNFKNVLLCGAVLAVSAGAFSSCDDDDDYGTRISVLETAVADLKGQLAKALTVGASVTNVSENDGTYVITLSDGQVITIKSGAGGGADVSVTLTDTEAIIKVGDTEYKLPLGSAVNSLIYSPEFADGEVAIADGSGAVVKFLARPALDNIDGAVFTIAESHELKSRAMGEEDFKVSKAEFIDGFVNLTVICINGDLAGTKHAASVQMNYRGAVIGSNYFTINVSSDFSFSSEAIDPNVKVTAPGVAFDAETNTYSFAVDGAEFGAGYDFASVFEGLAEGDYFEVASSSKQAGDASDMAKRNILAASLSADGKFKFAERPGTNFGSEGFLVNVKRGETVVAKTRVIINDRIAGINFGVTPAVFESEWGGREKALELGAQRVDIQKAFANYLEDITIRHGDSDKFFEAWPNLMVADGDDVVLYCNGTKLILDDLGTKYAPADICRGIVWFYRGLSVRLPENMAPYTDENGKEWTAGGEGYGDYVNGNDMWMGTAYNFCTSAYEQFYPETARYLGLRIDEATGELVTPDSYTGWGFRMAIGCGYEYLYGVKDISTNGGDQVGMLFFNRRVSPAGATMPLSDIK